MLKITNLSAAHWGSPRGTPVIREIDLSLEGEKALIVGPNGSGKSTLFKAILGLADVRSGEVRFNGGEGTAGPPFLGVSTNLESVYHLINLEVEEVTRLHAEIKGKPPGPAFDWFHRFELDEVLRKPMRNLSTGQRKLVGDILAISFDPKLALLDEPFDDVDQRRRVEIMRILRDLPADILMCTHELDLVRALPGWTLYFMLEGRLWGKFPAEELDQLYLTRGEVPNAVAVLRTSFGVFSVTRGSGGVALSRASSFNTLLESSLT